jgi:hypothetical protein
LDCNLIRSLAEATNAIFLYSLPRCEGDIAPRGAMRMVIGGEDRRMKRRPAMLARPPRKRITKARFERVKAVWLSKTRWTMPACEKKIWKGKGPHASRFWARFRSLSRFAALKAIYGKSFSRARKPYSIGLYRFANKRVRKVFVDETITRALYHAARVPSAARHLSTGAYTVR